jgi:hypothetical protein
MSSEREPEELSAADRELESALRALRPASAGIDPLVLAYRAGAARRQTSLWMWRAVAAVFAVATGLVVLHANREPILGSQGHAPSPAMLVATEQQSPSYHQLRQRVLDEGLDALAIPVSSQHTTDDGAQPSWRPS